jgi:hypothetical protein
MCNKILFWKKEARRRKPIVTPNHCVKSVLKFNIYDGKVRKVNELNIIGLSPTQDSVPYNTPQLPIFLNELQIFLY